MGNKHNILKTSRTLNEDQIKKNQDKYYTDLHSHRLFKSDKREAAIDYFNSLNDNLIFEKSNIKDSLSSKAIRSLGRRLTLDILFYNNSKDLNLSIAETVKEKSLKLSHEVVIDTENNTTSDIIEFKKKTKTLKIDLRDEQPIRISVIPVIKRNDIQSVNTDKMRNINPQKYKLKTIK
jgi:hypothetical protein